MSFQGKTVFISGASRGIGAAIGLRLAREGANIVIAAKTTDPHPKLPGTIFTTAAAVEKAGGRALPLEMDVRFEDQVEAAVKRAVDTFGGIDILVNNASAISLTPTPATEMKRYDLMHSVNVRGAFLLSKTCLPHLHRSENPHILNLSPPLNLEPRWFANHLAYTMSKYGMSMCVLGMAEEFKQDGIAVNALWPRTIIATAAVQNLLGGDAMVSCSRTPEIVADAAFYILRRPSRSCTSNFFIDEEVLREEGFTDLSGYAVDPQAKLVPDLFL
jgi:citronellol/citronellal dehydrogenase